MSAPPKDGGFSAQAQGNHLAHDTGVAGICVHTVWPTCPARALDSPANACSRAWATACQGHIPLAYGRRLAQRLLGTPRTESEAGVQDWELLERRPCVQFTPGAQSPPPGLAQSARDQYLLTQAKCEAGSRSLQAQREPGLQPRPAASGHPEAFILADQPLRSWGSGHSQAQCGGFTGAGQRVDTHTITPPFQAPSIFRRAGPTPQSTSFPTEVASGPCKYFHRGKSNSSQGFLFLEAKPRLAVKNAWKTN